jgi:hypothetical protein
MGQFKPMPKMETTEPSVELKLKKGGKVKKMQMGGNPMMAGAQMPVSPRRRMAMAPKAMARQPMMMRKDGGKMESMKNIKKHERNERDELKRVEKELKSHESMRASKAHKGLKNGGAPKAGPNVMGGLAGGLEATRTDKKKTTGGVRAPGYKNGGALNAKGMAVAKKYMNKMNSGDPMPTVKGSTKGLEGSKFKKGGAVASKGMAIAKKYMSTMNSGSPMPTVKGKTGSLEGSKFKNGGHAEMSCKAEGGFTKMKKMQKC